VEKIMIVSEQLDRDNGLIALLKALFPECEICIIPSNMENLEAYPGGSSSGFRTKDAKPSVSYRNKGLWQRIQAMILREEKE
jgi:hypothetical protein